MKRVFDFTAALFALIFLSPVLAVLAIFIRANMGSPVLFRQIRPGLHARPFTMIKFRTMRDATDRNGEALPDSARLTSLGRFLRATSLDELPELWNVLKGEMSLVGPRPLLMGYLPYYTLAERARFSVRPGITGLAQINGRNSASWNDRLSHDIIYSKNTIISKDIVILVKTIVKIFYQSEVITDPRSAMLDLNKERINFVFTNQIDVANLPSVSLLIQNSYDEGMFKCSTVFATGFANLLKDQLEAGDRFTGLFRGNKIIGVAQTRLFPDRMHLNNFAVLREEQGWGTADLLLGEVHKNRCANRITLHVDGRNIRAHAFYQRHGYRVMRSRDYSLLHVQGGSGAGKQSFLNAPPESYLKYGFAKSSLSSAATAFTYFNRDQVAVEEGFELSYLSELRDWLGNGVIRLPWKTAPYSPDNAENWVVLEMERN